jgi:hypothetical protein
VEPDPLLQIDNYLKDVTHQNAPFNSPAASESIKNRWVKSPTIEACGAKVGGGVLLKEATYSPSPTRRGPQFPGAASWLPRPQRKVN